jgi:hypothetical protein
MLRTTDANAEYFGDAGCLPARMMDLIRERNRRLVTMPPYDRFIANAAGHLTLQAFWRNLKRRDEEDLQRLEYQFKTETRSDAELRERATQSAEAHAALWVAQAAR